MAQGLPTDGVEVMQPPTSTAPAQPTWLDERLYPWPWVRIPPPSPV
jgi:hypothetical protein